MEHEYTITWREAPEDREHAKSEHYEAHDAVNLIAHLLHAGCVEVSVIRQDVFDQENGRSLQINPEPLRVEKSKRCPRCGPIYGMRVHQDGCPYVGQELPDREATK